ncbi:MAG: hypothetical protein VZR64_05570 [Eubacterium sp.]|nr:hypothetical protein [Eubacterium sp.]
MVLKGYLVEKYNNMSGAYTCNRLVEEAKVLGMDLRIIGIHDTYVVDGAVYNAGAPLEKRDFLINRYKWGKVPGELSELVTRTYNPYAAFAKYVNKFEQVKSIRSEEFRVPRYILGTALLPYETIIETIGLPFVAKGLENSMGAEISLIQTPDDYKKLSVEYDMSKEWLFEEYISTSYGRDLRFYSIRGNAVAAMVRKSQGDFRANVALGASVEPHAITPKLQKIAADIYAQTKLDFLGIDLLFGKSPEEASDIEDELYFCEINVMPGIEGIEEASGQNIAGHILRTIKEDFEIE